MVRKRAMFRMMFVGKKAKLVELFVLTFAKIMI